MPAWLHCPMVPQDAEDEPGLKGQQRGLAHWAPSGLTPRAKKGQGLDAKGTASPSILLIPRWFLGLLCAHPLPSRQHCPAIWCLSAPRGQRDRAPPGLKLGQKSGGSQHGAQWGPRRTR